MKMKEYKECAKKHTSKHEEIGWKQAKTIERKANSLSKMLSWIFIVGQEHEKTLVNYCQSYRLQASAQRFDV